MKNFVILFCCALLTFQVTAQTTFTDDLDKLIAEGMLTAAEAKVDSALMINPGNVDALYYKGNIQYYKYEEGQGQVSTLSDHSGLYLHSMQRCRTWSERFLSYQYILALRFLLRMQ